MYMTTTNSTSRRRATNLPTPVTKSRVRSRNNGIEEGIFIPFKVNNAEDGGKTKFSDYSTYLELEHIVSGAKIKTLVFGDILPNSIESKILDCILQEGGGYELEDLVGGGFAALLEFKTKNDKTYINIKDVKPLDNQHQKLLQEALEEEQLASQQAGEMISEVEDEMDGIGLFSEDESSNESTKNYSSSVTANNSEEIEENNFDSDEETEVFLCDICKDKGCEECDLLFGLDEELESDEDDTCLHCYGRGCEFCDETEEYENNFYNGY